MIHHIDLVENEKIVLIDPQVEKKLKLRGSEQGVGGTGKLNKPMVVIDGKTSTQEDLGKLSPSEISNITVLKNETAIKEYGHEAANGVIVVVTKKAADSKE